MNIVSEWIFNPRFWLPENYSWTDVISKDQNFYYGEPKDLCYSFYTAIFIFFFRFFVEKCIWEPVGLYFGLSHRKYCKAEPNEKLESEYRLRKRPNNSHIKQLSKKYKIDEIYLQRWFRRRRNQNKSDILTKFTESGWRFTYYISIFIIGCWILSDQAFVWDSSLIWVNIPFFNITPYMFWYIMVELGYYWASLITIFFDVKRKDFWEMLIHHLVTISLICLAWVQNFIAVSLFVLCLHDVVDYIMEAAKMMRYVNKIFICHILFIVFTLAWFFSRLVLYPTKIIYSAFAHAPLDHIGAKLCRTLLLILQILHVMWFIMILRIASQAFDDSGIHKDSRSDSEMSLSEDDAASNENNNKIK